MRRLKVRGHTFWGRLRVATVLVVIVALVGLISWNFDQNAQSAPGVLHTARLTSANAPFVHVAVDTRTRRAFVLTTASDARSTLSVLDTTTGALLRSEALGRDYGGMAVDEGTGRLFIIHGQGNRVQVRDSRSGTLLRLIAVGRAPSAILVDARTDHVFVSNTDSNSVSMLDARDGAVLRTAGVGPRPGSIAIHHGSGQVFVSTAGNPANNWREAIEVLDTHSAQALTPVARAGGGPLFGYQAVAIAQRSGRLVAAQGTSVTALDVHTLRRVWAVVVPWGTGSGSAPPIVDEATGHIFLVNDNVVDLNNVPRVGSVIMLDARSGATLHTTTVGKAPLSAAGDGRSGRVFICNARDHTVSVLDALSGRILRTITVAGILRTIVVDEQAGHALVVSAGGTTRILGVLSHDLPDSVSLLDAR